MSAARPRVGLIVETVFGQENCGKGRLSTARRCANAIEKDVALAARDAAGDQACSGGTPQDYGAPTPNGRWRVAWSGGDRCRLILIVRAPGRTISINLHHARRQHCSR